MLKKLHFKSWLLMLCMMFGVGNAWAEDVTLQYSGSTTNMTDGNNAASLGVSATAWNVIAFKGSGSLFPGLNKDGSIRLYTGGNGFTVTSLNENVTIQSIAVTFTGANYSNATVLVNENEVTASDGVYEIGASSFTIKNNQTSGNQVRISQIVITYTSGGSKPSAELSFNPTTLSVELGGDFTEPTLNNPHNVAVTYASSDENVAEVDTDGSLTIKGAGTATITATFVGNDNYAAGEASYTLTVVDPDAPGASQDNPYTVAQALEVIDGLADNGYSDFVYVEGIISNIKSLDVSNYKRAQYYISADGSTNSQLYVYNGYYLDGADFTSNDQIQVGDEVVVYGKLQKYVKNNTVTPEVAQDNYIVSIVQSGKPSAELSFNPTTLSVELGGDFTEPTLNNPHNVAVTYASSDENVAEVDTDGSLTINGAGTATITATFAGNDNYAAGEALYTLTVVDPDAPGASQDNPYTVEEAIAFIETLGSNTSSNDVYVKGTISQIDEVSVEHGNATYWISDDGGTDVQMEVYRGKYLGQANFEEGQIAVGDEVIVFGKVKNYNGTPEFTQGNYIVSHTPVVIEKQDPTINVADASVAYGSTYTINATDIQGGDITVASGNEAVATVNGLVITPVAVGTVVITVATAESAAYNAGSKTFTLTVTAPEGKTEAPQQQTGGVMFEETFDQFLKNSSNATTQGGNDNGEGGDMWSGNAGATNFTTVTPDNEGWTVENGGAGYMCAKFGASKKKGTATTPSISATVGSTYTLTFKAAPWASEETTMNVTAEGATISDLRTEAMETGQWNEFTATITATAESFTITFAATKNRFFLDEVKVEAPAQEVVNPTVKLNGNGYASYANEYPLSFADATDYTAWKVTGVSGTNITFDQVTGSVKGGTGLILMGEAGATIELTYADSDVALGDNLLEGTLAPTYVEANKYYGLSGNQFLKVKAGTVKAGKAILPQPAQTGEGVKAYNFVFRGADGVERIETVSAEEAQKIFDLSGRQLAKPVKGVNIINGRKVVVK